MTEDIPIVKTCQKCIALNLYAGSGTGDCRNHPEKGWIGTQSPACEDYWPATQICLTCKHWDKYRWLHTGICEERRATVKCDSYCRNWEERPNVREYLEKMIEGDE